MASTLDYWGDLDMVTPAQSTPQLSAIHYPDSDGQPMADNTRQFEWIVLIKKNLDWLFESQADVFVAGDLLWYPVEGRPDIRVAPDVLVVFGRPKGDRGSYQQWAEANLPPQVVFEILSPGNTAREMDRKLLFYNRYGVEEYYIYDPDTNDLRGFRRQEAGLEVIEEVAGWQSPRLGITFDWSPTTLILRHPDGSPFLSYTEVAARAATLEQEAIALADELSQVQARSQTLSDKLRELGVDPDQL